MMKALKWFSAIVLVVCVLSVYSFAVYRVGAGGSVGSLTNAIKDFSTFPIVVKNVLESSVLSGVPDTYLEEDVDFEQVNNLDYDLYALNSFWNGEDYRWDIRLWNLRNDEVVHEWQLTRDGSDFTKTRYIFTNAEVRNCLLNPDKSIIAANDETPNMTKLDAESNVVWKNHDMVYHHSLNFDADKNIWACGSNIPEDLQLGPMGGYFKNLDGRTMEFREDYIVKVDNETGKTLFKKGVSEILVENGYKNFVYGVNNPSGYEHDPIHLNDVEPILEDGPYWKKGDLLLSLRHRSLVFLYRPSTNEVIHLVYGPLLNQHDVDVLNDSTLTIFNNNIATSRAEAVTGVSVPEKFQLNCSHVIEYSMKDSSFTPVYVDMMLQEDVRTYTQGFQQTLSNGDMYIESENQAKIFIVNDNGFVLKKAFETPIEGYVERPNWIRLFENLNLN